MKRIFILLLVLLIPFLLAGCMPQYTKLGESPNKGQMLEVNGIIYKTLPDTIWGPINIDRQTLIATCTMGRNSKYKVYIFNEDKNRIFIAEKYIKPIFSEFKSGPERYYYRDDVALPPSESSSVNSIRFKDANNNKFSNIVNDRKVIEKLFVLIKSAQKDQTEKIHHVYTMELTNIDYPGICIRLDICAKGNTYWIYFNDINNYQYSDFYYAYYATIIPQDLLEEIAGTKLQTAREMSQIQ